MSREEYSVSDPSERKPAQPSLVTITCVATLVLLSPCVATSSEAQTINEDLNPGGLPQGGTSPDWWSRVQQEIADSEYEVTWQVADTLGDVEAAWHAPNRAHGFRTYFTEEGIRVFPRQLRAAPCWWWPTRRPGAARQRSALIRSKS